MIQIISREATLLKDVYVAKLRCNTQMEIALKGCSETAKSVALALRTISIFISQVKKI